MRIAVFGLGRVGLPLAVQAAISDHDVVGADGRANVVNSVNDGEVPFPADSELRTQLADALSAGSVTATTDVVNAASKAEVAVISAPLIVDQRHGHAFDAVSVTNIAAGSLRPGALVIYETTGTGADVRARFTSSLERASGLRVGRNLFVAFNPTNTLLGRSFTEPRRDPNLVVGADDLSASLAATFYRSVLRRGAPIALPKARSESAPAPVRKVEAVSLAAS